MKEGGRVAACSLQRYVVQAQVRCFVSLQLQSLSPWLFTIPAANVWCTRVCRLLPPCCLQMQYYSDWINHIWNGLWTAIVFTCILLVREGGRRKGKGVGEGA